MKKLFYPLSVALLLITVSCDKKKNDDGVPAVACNLPSSAVPSEMIGAWASGYNSSTNVVDAYNGQYLGNAWQSGKYFKFQADGKHAEFYYMAVAGLNASSATKVTGTVTFDEDEGSFIFHACRGHYKGWQGTALTVDRDATENELANNLTRKYYYSFETIGGVTWLRIRINPAETNPSSFRSVN